jgi:hypothetical protein
MNINALSGNDALLILALGDVSPNDDIGEGIILKWLDNYYAIVQWGSKGEATEYTVDGWHMVYFLTGDLSAIDESQMRSYSTLGAIMGHLSIAAPSIGEYLHKNISEGFGDFYKLVFMGILAYFFVNVLRIFKKD